MSESRLELFKPGGAASVIMATNLRIFDLTLLCSFAFKPDPACEELHLLPNGWCFNGDLTRRSFASAFQHSFGTPKGKRRAWRVAST